MKWILSFLFLFLLTTSNAQDNLIYDAPPYADITKDTVFKKVYQFFPDVRTTGKDGVFLDVYQSDVNVVSLFFQLRNHKEIYSLTVGEFKNELPVTYYQYTYTEPDEFFAQDNYLFLYNLDRFLNDLKKYGETKLFLDYSLKNNPKEKKTLIVVVTKMNRKEREHETITELK